MNKPQSRSKDFLKRDVKTEHSTKRYKPISSFTCEPYFPYKKNCLYEKNGLNEKGNMGGRLMQPYATLL